MTVIDFCLTKSLVCDPDTKYSCLKMEWASKANCKQRQGEWGGKSFLQTTLGKGLKRRETTANQFCRFNANECVKSLLPLTISYFAVLVVSSAWGTPNNSLCSAKLCYREEGVRPQSQISVRRILGLGGRRPVEKLRFSFVSFDPGNATCSNSLTLRRR